jgi:hypothetical protein
MMIPNRLSAPLPRKRSREQTKMLFPSHDFH